MKTYQKLFPVIALGLSVSATANSAVLYDNLSVGTYGEQGIPPGWIANGFSTADNCPNGCRLGNITLRLSGSIDGSIQGILLQLFADDGSGVPGATAVGHAYINPLNVTSTPGNNVFTPNSLDSALTLSNNTKYWVKLDANAPGAASVNWSFAVSGVGKWAFDSGGDAFNGEDGPFQMRVEANPLEAVPVPASIWLMASALLGIASTSRKRAV